ncbi:helix-turn-helix domain-containing protein [Saccharothrix luteola]|uniref:helix-turn-helix domain-containing protein n=1 Tax=Saccharothrix luteola TaxID=2893018 RepID=UPI001E52E428|nr:helix-turn-helix transcriptional regulator [Saccharothrix luteola]MCC8245055.1 helix-turn-helix domain-containing protein [Saccharothrix luteola]
METDEQTTTTPRMTTARSRELGEELRRIRHRARKSSADTAAALGWSLGKLSKLETGSRGTSPWEIGVLTGRLGADKPTRDRILAIATEPDTGSFLRPHDNHPDTLTALRQNEHAALTITTYQPLTIPDLAQTEDYTHALTGDRTLARNRAARQEVLHGDTRPDTILYVHEAAVRSTVGTPTVMRDQLRHLTLMCDRARTSLRLIPMAAPFHPALARPATILTFTPPTRPLAYVETDTAIAFHDDPDTVAHYETKMRHLDSLALSTADSRDVFARRDDAYDRDTR